MKKIFLLHSALIILLCLCWTPNLMAQVITTYTATFNSATDLTAFRPSSGSNSTNCNLNTTAPRQYNVVGFQVATTGTYRLTFNMPSNANFDALAYIYTSPFVIGTCGAGFVRMDDDSGPNFFPELGGINGVGALTLTSGTQYYLVTSAFDAGAVNAAYEWTVNGAGAVNGLGFVLETKVRLNNAGNEYLTLQEAIDNAVDGDTINLLKNLTESNVNCTKSIILKPNGFNFTLNGTTALTIAANKVFKLDANTLTLGSNSTIVNNGTLWNNGTIISTIPFTNTSTYIGTGILQGALINNGTVSPGN